MSDDDVRPIENFVVSSLADEYEEFAAQQWARSVIEPFANLRHNWDSYGAYPLDPDAAEIGVGVLAWIARAGVPLPQTFPTADGGLSLEWHRPSLDFVISLTPPDGKEPPSAYFRSATEEWEQDDLRVLDGRLDAAMAVLAGEALALAS
jgi:hypothetical protein